MSQERAGVGPLLRGQRLHQLAALGEQRAGFLRLAQLEPALGHLAQLVQLARREPGGAALERGAVEQGELAGAVGGGSRVGQVDQRAGPIDRVGDRLGNRRGLVGVGGGHAERRLSTQEVSRASPLEPSLLDLLQQPRGIEPAQDAEAPQLGRIVPLGDDPLQVRHQDPSRQRAALLRRDPVRERRHRPIRRLAGTREDQLNWPILRPSTIAPPNAKSVASRQHERPPRPRTVEPEPTILAGRRGLPACGLEDPDTGDRPALAVDDSTGDRSQLGGS